MEGGSLVTPRRRCHHLQKVKGHHARVERVFFLLFCQTAASFFFQRMPGWKVTGGPGGNSELAWIQQQHVPL